MKKYEAYKNSGIEWIGEIPVGWEILKMRYILSGLQDGTHGTFERVDEGYPLLSAKNVYENGIIIEDKESYISKSDYEAIISNGYPQKGDIAICCVGSIGRCCIYTYDIPHAFQRSVTFMRTNELTIPEYLVYYLRSFSFQYQLGMYAKTSAQSGIYLGDIAKTLAILPSVSEQQTIASYLDHKVGQIDASVSAINTQIDELRSYRQSIISEAVTKGLNPNAKMKDSGIEWIGKIPEEWEFRKIKTLLTRDSDNIKVGPFGASLSGNDIEAEGNYWVYNQRTILDNNFTTNNSFVSDDKYQELKSFSVYPGDVLITTRGTIGKVAIVPEGAKEGILHPCVIRFKVDESMVNKQYLKYIFNDCNIMSEQVKYGSNATTIEVIYSYTLKDLKMPVPSLSEQQAIATYLDIKTSKIDSAIKSLEAQRDDLNAFKQSIISEAVTGKIDLREWKQSVE